MEERLKEILARRKTLKELIAQANSSHYRERRLKNQRARDQAVLLMTDASKLMKKVQRKRIASNDELKKAELSKMELELIEVLCATGKFKKKDSDETLISNAS